MAKIIICARESKKWWNAFWFILLEPASLVGTGFWWKKTVLFLAVLITIYYPCYALFNSLPYRGAIPPEVQLIKISGRINFENRSSVKNQLYARLVMDRGNWFRLEESSGLEGVRDWEDRNKSKQLYVEGFRLLDGNGAFWPTYVMGADGTVLLSQDEQLQSLKYHRNPLKSSWPSLFILSIPLWVISISIVRKVKAQ